MTFEGKLVDLIKQADCFDWKLWVYSELYDSLSPDTLCVAIDADNSELGTDDFTPLEVEKRGFQELISMQDLQTVLKNTNNNNVIKAIDYYVKNDAYMP